MAIKHLKVSGIADGADASLVQPSDWNAGHVSQFRIVTAGESLVESDPVLALVLSLTTFSLPTNPAVGATYTVRNSAASANFVWVVPPPNTVLDVSPAFSIIPGERLVLRPGDTVQIVARAADRFEVVSRDASAAVLSVTISPAANFEASVSIADDAINVGARILAWLIPNADWDADELADYRVTASPENGQVVFQITAPGPIGGTFDIAYTWR